MFAEGYLVDDNGILIKTYAVHLGLAASAPWPQRIPVLVKGSARRFAIERCQTIRIAKPECFRHQGETLISDLGEGVTRHEESSETMRVDDANDLIRAAEIDDEMNRGAAAIGSTHRRTVKTTTSTDWNSSKITHTYGNNGWIWCAAVEPESEQQWESWLKSLGDDYDCVTSIYSARDFARQLALISARQIGARGSTATLTHPLPKLETKHPSMSVFHGAVAYVEDPHTYVSAADNDFERMMRAVFFKQARYADQREYRFVVWSEVEPEQAFFDLRATPELLANIGTKLIGRDERASTTQTAGSCQVSGAPVAVGSSRESGDEKPNPVADSDFAASDQPHQPIHVVVSQNGALQSAVAARFAAVIETFRQTALEEGIPINLCAAAFHLEWIVMRLLLTFVDPIERLEWVDGVFVVTFNSPEGSNAKANMSVGPNGTAQFRITTNDGWEEVSCEDGFLIADTLIEDLSRLGLVACATYIAEGKVPPQPSIALQETERVDKSASRSAQIHRISANNAHGLTEAEIDAANSETKPQPDDARIRKLVVDAGTGGTAKMHGIRRGLTGTFRQRVRDDYVSFQVETMNPNATISLDPPDSANGLDGHVVETPDGQDTVVTVTATSPDGKSKSEIKFVAIRSAAEGQ